MSSAQTVFMLLFGALTVFFFFRSWLRRDLSLKSLTRPFLRLVEAFSTITAELTILLATLGILTATFTITGVPTKVGVILMEGAGVNLALMVLVAFGFGYIIGMGLPVAPTYIITAVVIAPFMIRAGFDPWVVHFFAFFVAVFGELSPPTSVVAAVTSRIADAPFVRTMMHALVICMPLMVMMGAVFTRPDMVVEPGLAQLPAFAMVLVGTLALSFAFQGRVATARPLDAALRALIGLTAFVAILHPSYRVGTVAAIAAAAFLAIGFLAMRRVMATRAAERAREAPAT